MNSVIEETMMEFIKKGILNEFFERYGGDVVSFLYELLSLEERMEIRRQDGYDEGKQEGIRLVAEKMKYEGMSASKISELTGLSLEEVEAIDTSDSK